jgi:hypothetical protein
MKHSMIKSMIALPVIGAVLMVLIAASPAAKLTYPRRWIPMWEGKRESIMIHTDNIVTVEPMFDPEALLARSKLLNKKAAWLDVVLADGRTLKVFEPFDEFMERIRRSQ